jgi:hypothetical protein
MSLPASCLFNLFLIIFFGAAVWKIFHSGRWAIERHHHHIRAALARAAVSRFAPGWPLHAERLARPTQVIRRVAVSCLSTQSIGWDTKWLYQSAAKDFAILVFWQPHSTLVEVTSIE